MEPLRLLIVSGPPEGERLRLASEAAGVSAQLVASAAEPVDEAVTAALVVLDPELGPVASIQAVRRRLGDRIPVFARGDAAAAPLVAGLVRRLITGPSAPAEVVAEVLEALREAEAPATEVVPERPARSPLLARLEAGIDEALEAEMREVVRGVTGAAAGREASAPGGPAAAPYPSPSAAPPAARADTRTTGTLEERGLPVLLGRAFQVAFTGRLRLRAGEVEKAIYFEAGRPVLATSTAAGDRLVELFLRQGRINHEQHDRAVRAAAETGRRMGALLVDLGIMKSSELLPAVREHYEEIIFSLFSWPAGKWQLEPDIVADPKRIRLLRHPAALVREGLVRGHGLDRIRRHLGSGRNVFLVAPGQRSPDLFAEFGFSPEEQRVLSLFDGVRSLDDLARTTGLPELTVATVALCLLVFGILAPAADGPPRPRVADALVRDARIARERLLARAALAREGDYFQLFGLDRGCDAADVLRAHERLTQELDPQILGPELERALADEVVLVRAALDEGLRVLASDRLRALYRVALPPEAPVRGREPGPVTSPSSFGTR